MECARMLPPYFKHGIFFFCGIELLYSALVMAINQKFWDLASKIFPIAYRMFNDTLLKGEPEDFRWGADEMSQLNMYQERLKLMWLASTLVVIFSMLCIVPQFCTTEAKDGSEITYCVKKPSLGQTMAPVLILLVLAMLAMLTWQWTSCEADFELFQRLFRASQKEESFLSEIEQQLNCISDDDKEVGVNWECDNTIDRSMLNERWMNPLFYAFFACHALMFAGLSLLNRDFGAVSPKDLLLASGGSAKASGHTVNDAPLYSIQSDDKNNNNAHHQQQHTNHYGGGSDVTRETLIVVERSSSP